MSDLAGLFGLSWKVGKMSQSLAVCLGRRDQDRGTGSSRRALDHVCGPSWRKPGPQDVIRAEDVRSAPRNPTAFP